MARKRSRRTNSKSTSQTTYERSDRERADTSVPPASKEEHDSREGKIGSNSRIGNDSDPNNYARSANDPAWYAKYPQLLTAAGNLPFAESFGMPINLGDGVNVTCANGQVCAAPGKASRSEKWSTPGLLTLMVKASYGSSTGRKDPLNVAAQQLFTNVRHANAGRKNYDVPDLMQYCMSVADILSYIGWCGRIYAYAFMLSQRNYFVGAELLKAQHIDYTSVTNNLANFRYAINAFITKVSGWVIPDDIDIFKRRVYMFSSLYSESDTANIKDQLYQYAPDGFYQFKLDSRGAGMLKFRKLWQLLGVEEPGDDNWYLSVDQIIKIGEELITNVYGDEDFALMSGDIIKAYGTNLLSIAPIPEAMLCIPVYEEYTLSQMRNASILPIQRGDTADTYAHDSVADYQFGDVYQNSEGNLLSVEAVTMRHRDEAYRVLPGINSGIITVTNPSPTVEDVIECTRLKCVSAANDIWDYIGLNSESEPSGRFPVSSGSDIIVEAKASFFKQMYDAPSSSWNITRITYHSNGIAELVGDTTTLASDLIEEVILSGFHWSPLRWHILYEEYESNRFRVIREIIASNIDNYTCVSDDNIRRLHEVALLSLLSVPGACVLVG